MLVDDAGQFLTQRNVAAMAKFKCRFSSDGIEVSYENDKILVPYDGYIDKIHKVQVWSSKLKANEVSTECSAWFSDRLGQKATLVKMTDVSRRYKRLFTPPFKTNLSFADGYPYLLLGEASMNTLNSKAEEQIPADRFRANIIISTSEAHEEDTWKSEFRIGDMTMKVIKPCARCVVTTIDQITGKKGKEPLKTLATYRQWSNKIWFGANAICTKPGKISVGDQVFVT